MQTLDGLWVVLSHWYLILFALHTCLELLEAARTQVSHKFTEQRQRVLILLRRVVYKLKAIAARFI